MVSLRSLPAAAAALACSTTARRCRRPSRSSPSRRPRTPCALTTSFLVRSPSPRILTGRSRAAPCPRPAARRGRPCAGVEALVERADVDREDLDAERVLEAALRKPALHRHLTAFEAEARAVVAGAGLLALDALARLSCRCPSPGRGRRASCGWRPAGFASVQRGPHSTYALSCHAGRSTPLPRPSPGARPRGSCRAPPRLSGNVTRRAHLAQAEPLDRAASAARAGRCRSGPA